MVFGAADFIGGIAQVCDNVVMPLAYQASLFTALSDDQLTGVEPDILGASVSRTHLSHGAWVDVRRDWIRGADTLFEELVVRVPWRAERRAMYDRVVDVPRLLCFYTDSTMLPHPSLGAAKAVLDRHYGAELGEPFATAGLCLYRDGQDSVAWHGDTIGRGATHDTMVAIISVGTPRALLLRPRAGSGIGGSDIGGGGIGGGIGGGETLRYELGHGDLLVMGGSCQRTWEHAVPKTARPTGPRISIQFRTQGVR